MKERQILFSGEMVRVQDISLADVLKEGVEPALDSYGFVDTKATFDKFRNLWNSINATRPGCAWDDNPWVWVEFEVMQ